MSVVLLLAQQLGNKPSTISLLSKKEEEEEEEEEEGEGEGESKKQTRDPNNGAWSLLLTRIKNGWL